MTTPSPPNRDWAVLREFDVTGERFTMKTANDDNPPREDGYYPLILCGTTKQTPPSLGIIFGTDTDYPAANLTAGNLDGDLISALRFGYPELTVRASVFGPSGLGALFGPNTVEGATIRINPLTSGMTVEVAYNNHREAIAELNAAQTKQFRDICEKFIDCATPDTPIHHSFDRFHIKSNGDATMKSDKTVSELNDSSA